MWSLYLSFKGFKLPWSFPTHNPDSISLSPSLGPSVSFSVSLSLSLSLSLYVYLSLSISLLGPCGSHFLLLLGSLPTQPYGINSFSSLATYVLMNGTLTL